VDAFGAVTDAAPLGAAGAATALGAVVSGALGLCGVFQQYQAKAMHTEAKRIARRLCSANMDGGL
jgi:hypothetical protein